MIMIHTQQDTGGGRLGVVQFGFQQQQQQLSKIYYQNRRETQDPQMRPP